MSELEREKFFNCLKNIFKNRVSDEELKKRIDSYQKYDSKDKIYYEICMDLYILFNDQVMFDYAIDYIGNFLSDFPSKEEINEKLNSKFIHRKDGSMMLDDNHKLIEDTLKFLCKKFNDAEIDYFLVGALPCYLKTNTPLIRYHDDIDFMINEDDLEKVEEILRDSEYTFHDKRLDSPKRWKESTGMPGGDHEVMAQHKSSEFHLGFFCFKRGKDNEIIQREYFKVLEDGVEKTKVFERIDSKEKSDLKYPDELVRYKDIIFKMGSLESTYNIKKYTMRQPGREKDIADVLMIERSGILNMELLEQIKSMKESSYTRVIDIDENKKKL